MILYSLFSRIKTGKNANKIVTYWEPWTIHGRVILLWWRSFSQQKQDLIMFRIWTTVQILRYYACEYITHRNICVNKHMFFHPCKHSPYSEKKVIFCTEAHTLFQNWMHFVQVYSLKGLMFWWSTREQIYGKFLSTVMINMFKRLM